jgi:hypothetical protein
LQILEHNEALSVSFRFSVFHVLLSISSQWPSASSNQLQCSKSFRAKENARVTLETHYLRFFSVTIALIVTDLPYSLLQALLYVHYHEAKTMSRAVLSHIILHL